MRVEAQRLGCGGAHWGASTSPRVDLPQLIGRMDLGRIVTGADGPATSAEVFTLDLDYTELSCTWKSARS
ncbi:hypothetical protein E2C01_088258 [Portunus trituberculatus]|uniref:Uncharacterized protein n=1 Tax=Portunus trituberculatus TaxID=210409 RepID=A0A5B7JG50_PORTR|nr:hypothetical protein [Portunus trituberculatus]